jgi:hypothetical protein
MGCQPILPGEFLTTGEPPLAEFLSSGFIQYTGNSI